MVGDILRVKKDVCLKKGTIVKVHAIDGDNFFREKGLKGCATCSDINDKYSSGGIWLAYLEPIRLTKDILKKNGWRHEFDKRPYMVRYDLGAEGKNCWMMWCIADHSVDIQRQNENLEKYNLCLQRVVKPCDYVHELIHALRECGLKELADNFKV